MDTFEAITTRRAIKHYDPEHVMSDEDLNQLLGLAILSPTSFNIQNWRFVAVRDVETKKALRAAAWDQAQVEASSVTFVICADLKAWDRDPQRYWIQAPQEVQDILAPMIQPFYRDKPELQRDEAMRSAGIAAQTIMLASRAMGYDSCPMIGFDPVKVAEIIRLPEDHVVCMMLPVGKRVKDAWPRPGQLPLEDVVIFDKFQ